MLIYLSEIADFLIFYRTENSQCELDCRSIFSIFFPTRKYGFEMYPKLYFNLNFKFTVNFKMDSMNFKTFAHFDHCRH